MVKGLIKNRVARNASWLVACKVIQSVLGLVIGMISARYLGPSNYGIIHYAASVTAFVVPVATLGFTNVLVQECINNKEEQGKIFGTAMLLSVFSSLACMVCVFAFAFLANPGEKEVAIVCVLYSIMLIAQSLEMIVYWFQANLYAKYSSVVSLIAYLCVSAYKIFLLVSGKNVYWFALSYSLDYFIIAFLSYAIYIKKGGQRFSFDFSVGKRIFNKSKYYIVSTLMVTIFAQTDKIMIKHMMNEANVGYYSAGVTCASITAFVFTAIIDSFRPVIFEKFKQNDSEGFELNLKRLYSIIIYLSLLQCIVMSVFSKIIIFILYGNDYATSSDVLKLIVWYTTFSYLGAVRNIWILAKNQQKYLWVINLSGALCNVLLNAIFITYWGIMGAALASLITQIFTNVIIGWIIRPIRRNNKLMISALNPKYIFELLKVK